MNRSRLTYLSLALLFVTASSSFSQSSLSISIGPSFPTGNFAIADPWDPDAGFAGTGMGMGIQYLYRFTGSAAGIFAGADALINMTGSEARSKWEDFYPGSELKLPMAINIPVSAGLDYILKSDEKFSLYGRAGLVASFFKYTSLVVNETGYEDYMEEYDFSAALGFVVGAGIAGNKLKIGVDYMGLGEHNITGVWKEGSTSGNLEEGKKKIGLISLSFGYIFR